MFICGMLLFEAGIPQNRSVQFEKTSFAVSLAKAAREHKLVFLDTYTSWCSACKWMDKTTFREDRVADFFNAHFVNVKFDTEKGEGIEIKKRYPGIHSYPTYFILDANGKELHRIVGGGLPDEFIAKVKIGMNPETCLTVLADRYSRGERGREFIAAYLKGLETAGQYGEAETLAADYIRDLGNAVADSVNWFLFRDYLGANSLCPEFQLMLERKSEFVRNNGKRTVEDKINTVFFNDAFEMYWGGERCTLAQRRMLRKMVRRNRTEDYRTISMLLDLADAKNISVAKLLKVVVRQLETSTLEPERKHAIFEDIRQIVAERGNIGEKEKFAKALRNQIARVPNEQEKVYYKELLKSFLAGGE